MITIINSSGFASEPMSASVLLVPFITTFAITLLFYVLRSIGLYQLAKRARIEKKFLAVIPFVWVYVACKLIGEERVFGRPFSKLALIFCLIISITGVLQLVQEAICYFPIIGNLALGRSIVYVNGIFDKSQMSNYVATLIPGVYGVISNANPALSYVDPYATLPWVYSVVSVISRVMTVLSIATLVIEINIYIYLFRKYWPEHYILAMILSFFGLFGIFTFVIRKKEPVNFMEFVRSKYGSYGYYGGYNNPYGNSGYRNPNNTANSNPYNPYGANRPTPPKTPFEEFAEKGEKEPFGEFNNDKKDKE